MSAPKAPEPEDDPLEVYAPAAQARFADAGATFERHLWEKFPDVLAYARSRGLSDEELRAAGVGFCSPFSDYRFKNLRGRLVVPVRDAYGRCLGFAGRKYEPLEEMTLRALRKIGGDDTEIQRRIDTWQAAKWINERYPKNRHLFGLELAKASIRERGYAILVEGYMDRLVCASRGLPNVVAICSASVSEIHAQLLRRYADKAVFLLDPDGAGDKGAKKGRETLAAAGIQPLGVRLPAPYDPDDFVREYGVRHLRLVMERSLTERLDTYELEA